MSESCRLCGAVAVLWLQVHERCYLECAECYSVQVSALQLPNRETERAHYDLHQNDPDDPAYRTFLSRVTVPLLSLLMPGSRGLDYGCGPGPALAAMLTEAGHQVSLFDPIYEPDPSVLEDARYDFITCTEVAEHFHSPGAEFERLASMLTSGGVLAVMTAFNPGREAFESWHYPRDPTHVMFYKEETFHWLSQHLGLAVEFPGRDVVMLTAS